MSHVSTLAETYVARKDCETQQPLDLSTYINVNTEVEALWQDYVDAATRVKTQVSWQDDLTGEVQFRDAFTALTMAYFSSARVLLSIVAPQLAASFLDPTDHCATILQASQYLQTYTIGCAYLRMATPLLLVALHSPELSQRRQATDCFERWIKKSMTGISALALESIHQHRASEKKLSILARRSSNGGNIEGEGLLSSGQAPLDLQ
jgi:hypothetical protein